MKAWRSAVRRYQVIRGVLTVAYQIPLIFELSRNVITFVPAFAGLMCMLVSSNKPDTFSTLKKYLL